MNEKIEINTNIPTKNDLIEALRYAEEKTNGAKNHRIDTLKSVIGLTFEFGDTNGWTEKAISMYKLAEQKLKLFVDEKIKAVEEDGHDYVWVVDGSTYDEKNLINH
ncbi:MAG: hypothetical protein WCF92_03495 [bacterium]